jgi:hypothetical protein
VQINKSSSTIIFMCPKMLWMLYQVHTSPTHSHVQLYYADGVLKFSRAGNDRTTLLALSTCSLQGGLHPLEPSKFTRANVPLCMALAISEHGGAVFCTLVGVSNVLWRLCHIQFQMHRFCRDMSAALRKGVREKFNAAVLTSDYYRHVADGPKRKWRHYIVHKNNVPLICRDLHLVYLMRSLGGYLQLLQICCRQWSAKGEARFADFIDNNHGFNADEHCPFYFSAVEAFGYTSNTQALERYWLSLQGNKDSGMSPILPQNKGFDYLLKHGFGKVLAHNAKLISALPMDHPPTDNEHAANQDGTNPHANVIRRRYRGVPPSSYLALAAFIDPVIDVRQVSDLPLTYMVNAPWCLGQPIRDEDIAAYEDAQEEDVDVSDAITDSVQAFADRTLRFCKLIPLSDLLISPRYNNRARHLSMHGVHWVCMCHLFGSDLWCPSQLWLDNRDKNLDTPIATQITNVYSRRQRRPRPGRRHGLPPTRVFGQWLFDYLGIPAESFANDPDLLFLSVLSRRLLEDICRHRRLYMRGETKASIISSLCANTPVGDRITLSQTATGHRARMLFWNRAHDEIDQQ